MDANKKFFFKKHSNNQFKRKGGTIKKGKCTNSGPEQSFGASQPADTVYRILCPSRKIGSVIGKGGGIVKALREDTRAKITVADAVPAPGADERVIIIYSSATKVSKKQNTDDDVAAGKLLEPHCAAQEALLKVHDRIVEEDLIGVAADDDNENNTITARLLVPNNMVGCVLGKGGDVIQRLRSGTGASIRVLPTDRLPPCAMDTDELVQVIYLFSHFCLLGFVHPFESPVLFGISLAASICIQSIGPSAYLEENDPAAKQLSTNYCAQNMKGK